eukprot:764153-Hanusia_phi.AAC.13
MRCLQVELGWTVPPRYGVTEGEAQVKAVHLLEGGQYSKDEGTGVSVPRARKGGRKVGAGHTDATLTDRRQGVEDAGSAGVAGRSSLGSTEGRRRRHVDEPGEGHKGPCGDADVGLEGKGEDVVAVSYLRVAQHRVALPRAGIEVQPLEGKVASPGDDARIQHVAACRRVLEVKLYQDAGQTDWVCGRSRADGDPLRRAKFQLPQPPVPAADALSELAAEGDDGTNGHLSEGTSQLAHIWARDQLHLQDLYTTSDLPTAS